MLYRAFYCVKCGCEIDVLVNIEGPRYRGRCIVCGKVSTVLSYEAKVIEDSDNLLDFMRYVFDVI